MAKEIIKNISILQFREILAPAFRAKVPVLAIGHKGIGKSEAVKQFCRLNNLELIDIRLSYMEAQDIVGFPYRDEKTGNMRFSPPEWLPEEGEGILFLDEINRARIDVLQAVFQLVRDREIGGIRKNGEAYRLPAGWSIVAAMNPDGDNEQYFVSPIDDSLYDRFLKVGVAYERRQFRRHVIGSDIFTKEVKSFIADRDIEMAEDRLEVPVDATPRSFELFSRIYGVLKKSEFHLVPPIAEGLIGPKNAVEFTEYMDSFYREVEELLGAIIGAWHSSEDIRQQVAEHRERRHDIIMALRDRFIIHYLDDQKAYDDLKAGRGFANFIHFIFVLKDEQVMAFLVSLRESLKGEYVSGIIAHIKSDDEVSKRYRELVEEHPDTSIGESL